MYQYTEFDKQFVRQRAAQFRDQLERNLSGRLPEDEFRALRLQNGWYVQRHAPMLRVAVSYGELSSAQLRALARIAREFVQGPCFRGAGVGRGQNAQACRTITAGAFGRDLLEHVLQLAYAGHRDEADQDVDLIRRRQLAPDLLQQRR